MVAHAQLAADLHLSKSPGNEGAERANGNDLPEAAFFQGREREAVGQIGRCDRDAPDVPGRTDRRAVD